MTVNPEVSPGTTFNDADQKSASGNLVAMFPVVSPDVFIKAKPTGKGDLYIQGYRRFRRCDASREIE
jgi:hypothetical protein